MILNNSPHLAYRLVFAVKHLCCQSSDRNDNTQSLQLRYSKSLGFLSEPCTIASSHPHPSMLGGPFRKSLGNARIVTFNKSYQTIQNVSGVAFCLIEVSRPGRTEYDRPFAPEPHRASTRAYPEPRTTRPAGHHSLIMNVAKQRCHPLVQKYMGAKLTTLA